MFIISGKEIDILFFLSLVFASSAAFNNTLKSSSAEFGLNRNPFMPSSIRHAEPAFFDMTHIHPLSSASFVTAPNASIKLGSTKMSQALYID